MSNTNPTGDLWSQQKLLALAALFQDDFSIDWLQEVSAAKASQIFSALDAGLAQHILKKNESGMICFIDQEKRDDYRDMLDADEKKTLHESISQVILREAEVTETTLFSAVPHLLSINPDDEGCTWLLKAGNLYAKNFRYRDAVKCYKKIIACTGTDASKDSIRIFIETVISFSRISDAEADLTVIGALLESALEKTDKTLDPDPGIQARLLMHLAKNEWLLSNFDNALNHFNKAKEIVSILNDSRLRRSLTSFMTFFLFVQGLSKDVVRYYEEFLPEIEQYPKGQFSMLSAIIVGISYATTGHFSKGMGMLDAIDTNAASSGNDYISCFSAYSIGILLMLPNRMDEAIAYFEKAIERGEKAPNYTPVAGSLAILATIYGNRGDEEKALNYYNRFLKLNETVKVDRGALPAFLELGWQVECGKLPHSVEISLAQEIERALNKNIFIRGTAYRYRALYKMRHGEDHQAIIHDLEKAIACHDETGNQAEIALTRFELARIFLSQENETGAREQIKRVLNSSDAFIMDMIPKDLIFLVEDLKGDKRILEEILKLSQQLVSIRDRRELVKKIIWAAIEITGAERGAIFIPNSDNPHLPPVLQAAKNLPQEDIHQSQFIPFLMFINETIRTGESNIQRIKTVAKGLFPGVSHSCICVPMKLRQKIVGVLYFDNRLLSSVFRKSDLEILEHFAALAAIAMDNALAYEKIQSLNKKLMDEKQYYREQHLECLHFEDFVGKSPAIMRVLSNVRDVAETVSTVLILGETGVGKELVARSIHRLSLRKKMPFIKVNCSAFSPNLIASELFGHEKGAFTGADNRRIGRFELADGGTLFLDEIGDISLEIQVALLRVLQSKQFERVGGKKTLKSDFRLIAATNKDLREAVRQGTFREDLYYRLNVFPIQVPPLRVRKEDVPMLVQHFLKINSAKVGKPDLKVLQKDMNRLTQYDWPGNVRELENLVERGTILSSDEYFVVPELGQMSINQANDRGAVTLKENEKKHILWALKQTSGKIRGIDGAAQLLDIHPNTLYGRMRKLGITVSSAKS